MIDAFDVLFSAGLAGYLAVGLNNCINKKTRVDRWNSGYGVAVSFCFMFGNYMIGLPLAAIASGLNSLTWMFVFAKRYTGMPDPEAKNDRTE